MNKTVTIVLVVLVLFFARATVFAKSVSSLGAGDYEVDGSFAAASGPGDFNSGYGINFGAGYMLTTIDKNLQGRIDLSYYSFSRDYLGNGLSYWRLPITVSARYYFPIIDRLSAFAQVGLETSWDSYDYVDAYGKHSKAQFNLGVSPGGGIEFFVDRNVSIFGIVRTHLITDSYVSMQLGAAVHF